MQMPAAAIPVGGEVREYEKQGRRDGGRRNIARAPLHSSRAWG